MIFNNPSYHEKAIENQDNRNLKYHQNYDFFSPPKILTDVFYPSITAFLYKNKQENTFH